MRDVGDWNWNSFPSRYFFPHYLLKINGISWSINRKVHRSTIPNSIFSSLSMNHQSLLLPPQPNLHSPLWALLTPSYLDQAFVIPAQIMVCLHMVSPCTSLFLYKYCPIWSSSNTELRMFSFKTYFAFFCLQDKFLFFVILILIKGVYKLAPTCLLEHFNLFIVMHLIHVTQAKNIKICTVGMIRNEPSYLKKNNITSILEASSAPQQAIFTATFPDPPVPLPYAN